MNRGPDPTITRTQPYPTQSLPYLREPSGLVVVNHHCVTPPKARGDEFTFVVDFSGMVFFNVRFLDPETRPDPTITRTLIQTQPKGGHEWAATGVRLCYLSCVALRWQANLVLKQEGSLSKGVGFLMQNALRAKAFFFS